MHDRLDPNLHQLNHGHIRLDACGGLPAAVHVIDEDSVLAINAALATGRPLLLRGEPGTGKSQLGRAAAVALGRAFLPHVVDARTETRDLLWTVDAVARLAEAQVMGALRDISVEEVRRCIDISNFLQPGVLWWAFDWDSALEQAGRSRTSAPEVTEGWSASQGLVVLIDEIDKADPAVPNGLLDALGHGRFDVPGRAPVVLPPGRAPLLIITTNEERALPDAFVRRCLVLHLDLPENPDELQAALVRRGRAHFKDCAEAVLREAARLLCADRAELRRQELTPPGCAEYIDLVRAVTAQAEGEEGQLALLKRVARFALCKHRAERAP